MPGGAALGAGLGRLMALQIAGEGGDVAAWDRDERGLEALLAEAGARDLPGAVCAQVVDLSSRAGIDAAVGRVLEAHPRVAATGAAGGSGGVALAGFAAGWPGRVDALVNNAGVVSGKPFLECSDRQVDLTMAVNALAPIWLTKRLLPGMLERGSGSVVTVASAAGLQGVATLVDYCASKHAAVGFMEALRVELKRGSRRVRTTLVCPYYIDTGMFEGVKTRVPLLLPIMRPELVARRIVRALARAEEVVLLPGFVRTSWLCRFLFPTSVCDFLLRLMGITASMDDFKGRGGALEGRPPAKKE